ncbi:MAG: hypothetical protein K1X94_11250, partial [Sandaracinaceae bacterium]|nr:hypothetical protein [Sandaracinaceae bacterium]
MRAGQRFVQVAVFALTLGALPADAQDCDPMDDPRCATPAEADPFAHLVASGALSGGQDLMASAPAEGSRPDFGREFLARVRGLDESRVGVWLDADFRPIGTPVERSLIRHEPYPTEASPRFEARYEHVVSTEVARAHASVWGLGSADLTEEGARQHASWRATQTVGVYSIEVSAVRGPAPAGARYIVSAVHIGRMLELHFHGDVAAVSGGLSALFPSGEIELGGRRAVASTSFDVIMLGLRPQGPVIPTEPTEAAFVADASPAVPILAEITPVRTAGPVSVRLARVEFINVMDGVGGPEIMVSARQGADQLLPLLRGPQDTATWAVPSERGAFSHPVEVSPSSPIRFEFQEDDALSDDTVGAYELSELYPRGEPQCFGGIGDEMLRQVRFCLVVEATPTPAAPGPEHAGTTVGPRGAIRISSDDIAYLGGAGAMDPEQVADMVFAHRTDLQRCYEAQLALRSTLRGRVALVLAIQPGGRTIARIAETSLNTPSAERCMAEVANGFV